MIQQPLPFIDLKAQQKRIHSKLIKAIHSVLDHGRYLYGPEILALEKQLQDFANTPHCITCNNGTSALRLVLMAEKIGAEDVVITPSFTFIATNEAPMLVGAENYFVDIDPRTYNVTPEIIEAAIKKALSTNVPVKAVIAVELFGNPVDIKELQNVCEKYNLTLICDSAQSFGSQNEGVTSASIASYTTTSFFPAKPLGGYGDSGAIFCLDAQKADLLRSLGSHGANSADRYSHQYLGDNSRMSSLQAAVLIEKLAIFSDEIDKRNDISHYYTQALEGAACITPFVPKNKVSTWAQYTLQVPKDVRTPLQAYLSQQGIPTAIYYPKPNHLHTPFVKQKRFSESLPVTEELCQSVISLPMHPYLSRDNQDFIIEHVLKGLKKK